MGFCRIRKANDNERPANPLTTELSTESPSTLTGVKAIAGWEIASVGVSCLIAEWVVLSLGGTFRWVIVVPTLMAVGLMILSHRERRETLSDLGFRLDNFYAAARLLLLPTFAAIVAILIGGWLLSDSGFIVRPLGARHLSLPVWVLFQQYALQGFINRRAQIALGKGPLSIVTVGVLFSLLHLPNPLLSVLTLIGGLLWAYVYQRQPNLLALALSHMVVSLSLALTFPKGLIDSLRVGFKYFA